MIINRSIINKFIVLLLFSSLSFFVSFAEAFGFRSKNSLPGFAFVEQDLDELGKFKIGIYRHTVSSYGDSHVDHTVQLMRYATNGSGGEKIPDVILKGFKITANDKKVQLNWNMRMVEGIAKTNISDKNIDQVRDFRIQFYGKELGCYRFDPVAETLTELEPPKAISRFTFRDLVQRGQPAIEAFKANGSLVDLRSNTAPIIDLHTDPLATIPFERMSEIYQARSPLSKTAEAFPDILESLAKDYQEQGIQYSELSFYQIVKPEFYEQLPKLLID